MPIRPWSASQGITCVRPRLAGRVSEEIAIRYVFERAVRTGGIALLRRTFAALRTVSYRPMHWLSSWVRAWETARGEFGVSTSTDLRQPLLRASSANAPVLPLRARCTGPISRQL